jgi:hypothetical protein
MAARMERVVVGGSPVPLLAAAAAVVLVVALAWNTTAERRTTAAFRDVPGTPTSLPYVEIPRPFSGMAAVDAMVLDPGPGFVPIPTGQDGTGPRTQESLTAAAQSRGGSADNVRAGLRAVGYLGGISKGWARSGVAAARIVAIDELETNEGAGRWALGLGAEFGRTPGATELPTAIDAAHAFQYDVTASSGVQHQVVWVLTRGRRVVIVKEASTAAPDVATAEAYARAQAARVQQAAP